MGTLVFPSSIISYKLVALLLNCVVRTAITRLKRAGDKISPCLTPRTDLISSNYVHTLIIAKHLRIAAQGL